MGSEDHPKGVDPRRWRSQLKLFLLIVSTNILTLYIFGAGPFDNNKDNWYSSLQLPSSIGGLFDTQSSLLNATHVRLEATESQLSDLRTHLHTSNTLLDTLLSEIARLRDSLPSSHAQDNSNDDDDDPLFGWGELMPEMKVVVAPHKLPLGYSHAFGTDEIVPPIGHACRLFKSELRQYMSYKVGGECPSDDALAQQLMLKGCEPLPRRRCHPKSPSNYVEPHAFPQSMWTTPPDTSIVWDPYRCKSYGCLIDRKNDPTVHPDCKDCFDLAGREKSRWLGSNRGWRGLDYSIDDVLTLKHGTIRIGLDIGGGSGTFGARMRERNVTVVTTSMNFDGPFNSFIASRGLVPLHLTVAHRLPFFQGTLDIVHSMHVLSNWVPEVMLEQVLYDVYRVLRPGGLFWVDHFFCLGPQLNRTYVPMFVRIGFRQLRWTVGRKADKGPHEVYLSAILEKPMF
ncbi:uncharacterized protein LOC18427844 [Amborella trichopoda]|uniref:Methyltransferase type 11 domain-containing protein n=1 Tax=Amborella trichopoda TaxID=13333 RepID=W1NWZ1_AMBTC|nr:uncharacterized protein LOC18427844 [Amborella trichopoda]ERM99805.1 hypothetical protein AMTR_s00099p00160150 [Amborella trichopoda]|eukprot:XP_006836952.1 uncharacterized protein LOC18427844 [Amborella trichopoda]